LNTEVSADDPLRVVFVGRAVEERKWTLTAPAGGVVPAFVDHRGDELVEQVTALRPHVVVVFGPDRLAPGLAGSLPAITVAHVLEPVQLPHDDDGSPWRTANGAASSPVGGFAATEYDRVLAADSRVVRTSGGSAVWRSPPLAVDDALYDAAASPLSGLRPLYLGESTIHREYYLTPAKHHYDLRHYAFGLAGEKLAEVLGATTVGVVLSPGPAPTFEAAAPLHLAAGHLLLASALAPPRGLEGGLDHLTFEGPGDLVHLLYEIRGRPSAFEVIRRRGRVRAEEFRASRIWPRLLRDLLLDLEAFGSPRAARV
jgi:hypothetical protein